MESNQRSDLTQQFLDLQVQEPTIRIYRQLFFIDFWRFVLSTIGFTLMLATLILTNYFLEYPGQITVALSVISLIAICTILPLCFVRAMDFEAIIICNRVGTRSLRKFYTSIGHVVQNYNGLLDLAASAASVFNWREETYKRLHDNLAPLQPDLQAIVDFAKHLSELSRNGLIRITGVIGGASETDLLRTIDELAAQYKQYATRCEKLRIQLINLQIGELIDEARLIDMSKIPDLERSKQLMLFKHDRSEKPPNDKVN